MKKRSVIDVSNDISSFLEIIFQYLRLLNGKTVKKNNEYFFFVILNKLSDNIFSVNKLFVDIKEFPHTYGGISLIMRTCMSDVIYFYYFRSLINPDEDDNNQHTLEESINLLWSDHIKFVISFDELEDKLGHLKLEDKLKEISSLNEFFKDYIQEPISNDWKYKLKNTKNLSLRSIFNEWLDNEPLEPLKDIYKKEAFNAYKLYSLFSKIEHNGELTLLVHNRAIETLDDALNDLYLSFEITLKTIAIIAITIFKSIEGAEERIQDNKVRFFGN